jgi:hypothetical protein
MLPKKRKFTQSEFENFNFHTEETENETETSSNDVGIDLSVKTRPKSEEPETSKSQQHQQQTDHAFRTVSKDRNSVTYVSEIVKNEYTPIPETRYELDLTDWIGHRILARRDNYFSSGVISSIFDGTSVVVLFDSEETPLVYHEVLTRESYGSIISDAIPSTKQVKLLKKSLP